MPRLLLASLSLAVAACAAGTADPTGTGGADPGSAGAAGNPNFTNAGSGGSPSTSCKHATYTTYAAGPDGVVGTSDDFVVEILEIEFGPGPADIAYAAHPLAVLTEDASAQPTMLQKWTYDANGARQSVTQYAAGLDGTFGSPDDAVVAINAYTSDTSGLLVTDLFHGDPGPDGIWDTADDTISASISFVHADGHIAWVLPANYPGPNGIWGDSDDFFFASYRLEYDGKGRLSEGEVSNETGPDGQFGTADDVTAARIVFPCRNDRVVEEIYSNPGPDGVWGSADDTMDSRVIESGDVCSSATCEAPITPW